MKRFITILILTSGINLIYAQVIFQKTYSGISGKKMEIANDGGYIISGQTLDATLLKTDSVGTVDWTKSYGGPDGDGANSVQQTDDGGYIMTGFTEPGTGSKKMLLLKTNSNGDTLWSKCYGNSTNTYSGNFVRQTADHGYIIIVQSFDGNFEGYNLFRIDSSGNLLWNYEYTGYAEQLNSVFETSDRGFIASGYRNGGYRGMHLLRTDSAGNILWWKLFSTTVLSNYVLGYALEKTTDGGFMIAGDYSDASDGGCYLIKTDSSANILWRKVYHSAYSSARSVHQTADGGYIVAGELWNTNPFQRDLFALKIDSIGNLTWMRKYGGAGEDRFLDMKKLPGGGCIILGTTQSFGASNGMYLIKTDSTGLSGCNDSVVNPTIIIPGLQIFNINIIYTLPIVTVTPPITINVLNPQINTLCSNTVGTNNIQPDKTFEDLQIYPNPATSSLVVFAKNSEHITITNLTGEIIIKKIILSAIKTRTELDISSLASGMYFIKSGNEVRKFMKE